MTKPKRKDAETIWEVDDKLWKRVSPLLVIDKPRKKSGRPRKDDRTILNGVIWLARTGSQWSALPREYGAKSTVHDRLQEWVSHGAFRAVWLLLLEEFDDLEGIDWIWEAADGCLTKAPLGKKGLRARRKASGGIRPTGESSVSSGTC